MSYNLVDPTTGDLTLVAGRNAIDDGSISNSKVWSSQKTSGEIAEKVGKTDIVTTIDSTSTDSQVPSAKSVYDTTSNFRKTYTSIKQLGLTIGSETIEDIANSMEDQTRLIALIYETEHNVSIYPYRNGTLIVEKINIYRVNLRFCEDISSNVYVSTYHGAKGFTGWKKVCTTTVADVPVTYISPADTTTFVNFKENTLCNYRVINGICYVNLENISIAYSGKMARTGVYLPKNAYYQGGTFLTGAGDATPHAYVFILKDTGELCFDVKDANTILYGSFSYPVAEN